MQSYPLTQTQLGIYLAGQNAQGNESYNIVRYCRLGTGIEIPKLKEALGKVFDNHAAFRARLATGDDGMPCFIYNADETVVIQEFEMRNEDELEQRASNFVFDLAGGPLYQLWIVRTAEDDACWLAYVIHHLIFDGVSNSIFFRDLQQAYRGEQLMPEAKTFMDICLSEKAQRSSEAYATARSYYASTFAPATDVVTYPAEDVPQPIVPVQEQWEEIDIPLAADRKIVKAMASRYNVPTDMLFYAAFGYVMATLSNDDKALFATIYKGRATEDTSCTMAMMVQTCPVFTDFSDHPSVPDALARLTRQVKATRQHTIYSFGEVVSELGVKPMMSIAYHGTLHDSEWRINEESLYRQHPVKHAPGFNLSFAIVQVGNDYRIRVFHNKNLHTAAYVRNICLCVDNVLRQMAEGKEFAEMQMLSAEQTAEVMALSKGEVMDYDTTKTPVEVIMQHAKLTPAALALADEATTLTYAELDAMTNALAHELVRDGVQPDQFVGVMVDRSVRFPISALAIHKAGAAYMPLDVDYPNERLSYMIENSEATVLVTTHAVLEAKQAEGGLNTDGLHIIYMEELDLLSPSEPICLATPDSLAYMIYTSGSTGKPKGAMLHQRGLMNFTLSIAATECLTPLDRIASHRSFSFDAHIGDLYPILAKGGSLHIMPSEIRKDLDAMYQFIVDNEITGFGCTTSLMMLMLGNYDLPVRFVTAGGEKLSGVASDHVRIINLYGPTECTNDSTLYVIEPGQKVANIPIGRPLHNMTCLVMSKDGKLLPQGTPGELCVAGVQVGRGYWRLPEKTAEAFIDSPLVAEGKLYRTGDLVRWNTEGQLEYLGRIDGQVKLRGFRIEMGEIESTALQVAGIKQVAAAVKEVGADKRLVLYYTTDDGAAVTDQTLSAHIEASTLAEYMHPEIYQHLDAMPQLPNGKIDRKHLPMPTVQDDESAADNTASGHVWNKLQSEIRQIIVGTLGIDNVGVDTPLRVYGLTSLVSMKLVAQLYKRFGVKIPSKTLGGNTVLDIEDALLQHLMLRATGSVDPNCGSRQPVPATLVEAPLTFPQQGVYIDCQMNPGTTIYNIPKILRFPQSVSAEALAEAVTKAAGAHVALFCNFFQTDSGVVMRKASDRTLEVVTKQLSADELEVEKQAFVRPFDLEHDRLVRAEIVRTPDGSNTLLLDMHHMVSDGTSLDLFISQIIALLNGDAITPETYDYLRFATEQNTRAEQGGLKEDKAFFDEMFAQYEAAATVPADKTSTEVGKSRRASTPIPAALLTAQLPEGVTQAHLWFAAFSYALSRFANTKDVFTAFVSSGRQNIDIADTVGMFVNTLPCAVHIKEQTVAEYLVEVSKTFNDAIDHENYPFPRIAADYDFRGSASFAYQLGVQGRYQVGGEPVSTENLPLTSPKIPLSIFIQHDGGVPCVTAEYDDSQYSAQLAQRFSECIVAVAEHFLSSPSSTVKTVSIMSESQRLEVECMHSVNEDLTFPIRTFHEGIEQWAERTPDALAIMACDRDMTYREYNAEANRMARALMDRGITRGDRVVLLLPRRSFYLTAMFAVMKCGAAFIPMDPEYPADRIAYILDDAQGRFVLTTAERVADYPGRAIDIAVLMEEARTLPDTNLDISVDPHDLAYLIYTSGSTGRPKGVMIEHLGAASFLTFYKHDTNFGSDSRANGVGLCQSSVSFDLSVGEIGVQVFNGDTVVFANEDEMMSPVEMVRLCRRTGAQTISGTPSRLAVNLELEEYHDLIKNQMKCVVTGGEKLPGALLDVLEEMDVYIINTYGPTETTMGSSAGVMNGTREVHVGKPFTNYTYQVLDCDLNELPVGVMGELCIGGIGLARGYNNMPERTAESFIEWHGRRIYRTGDYAMWTAEGNVIIMGRTDNQVKLNGLRIELGEIETVMSQQPGMRQCVAVIKKLGRGIDKLIGYYTVDETVSSIAVDDYEEQMRTDMAEHLTPYMVPGIFVRLDEMPLTPVGKTDVARLPLPTLQAGEYVRPANEAEQAFCEIYAKILNLDRVGATENFFDIGGTSLVAMQLIAEAARAGYTMVYKTVFDNATPRALARLMRPDLYDSAETPSDLSQPDRGRGEAGRGLPLIAEIEDYDYSGLDDVMAANTLDTFNRGECYERMGNVLLLGATGFLGIHVLHNLILRDDVPHIYCLVRGSKSLSAASRLRTLLFYYFDDAYETLFDSGRIVVIEGDVTDATVFSQFDAPLDVVINCAANVKHFSAGTDIEDINIKGCQNGIDLCLRTGARFVQTSTGSIAGSSVGEGDVTPVIFTERDLYHGQELPTKYSASKFLAERAVLHAVAHQGLRGKVMRLGNLSARSTDGQFQINFRSNNAMATLKAYQVLGCVPYEREFGYSEYSPINEVADAIVRLTLTPDSCTVFHPANVHWPPYGDTIESMNRIGIPIERVETTEFQRRLTEAMADATKSELVQSLVAYSAADDGRRHVMNGWDTRNYSAQVLLRLGFRWSYTTWDYVENYLRHLMSLGVFDSDYRR